MAEILATGRTYEMAPCILDYWAAVTDVRCPACGSGTIRRWTGAGYIPGRRRCDHCGREFLTGGRAEAPTLVEQD